MPLKTIIGATKADVSARATALTGLAKIFDVIPDILACVALVLGMVISILLYRVQRNKSNLEVEKLQLEIEAKKNG